MVHRTERECESTLVALLLCLLSAITVDLAVRPVSSLIFQTTRPFLPFRLLRTPEANGRLVSEPKKVYTPLEGWQIVIMKSRKIPFIIALCTL